MIKIRKNRFLFIVLVMGLTLLISGCTSHSRLRRISENMEVNIDSCKIDNEKDTHGGFLGDGETFMLLDCSDMDDQAFSEWKPLPLPDVLKKRIYEDICCYDECVTTSVRYSIPEFSEGYYFFNNRHYEAESKDDLNIYEPYSYNFTIAIYDKPSKHLYYYELDT